MFRGASREPLGRDIILPVQVGEKPLKLFPVLLAGVHRCRRSTRIRRLHPGRDRNGGAENLSPLFLFARRSRPR